MILSAGFLPWHGRTNCSTLCYICIQFSGAWNAHFTQSCHFNEVFFSACLSTSLFLRPLFSLCVCLYVLCAQFPRQMMTPVRPLPTTQSGQTSKYTTLVSDWAAENEQQPIARCWSIFGWACKAQFVPQSIWKGTSHLLGFLYSMFGKRKSTDHGWLMSKPFIFML